MACFIHGRWSSLSYYSKARVTVVSTTGSANDSGVAVVFLTSNFQHTNLGQTIQNGRAHILIRSETETVSYKQRESNRVQY
jgi:hypothetical protein